MAVRPDIYDPLEEYATVFRDKFKQIANDTFDQIAKEANVDVDANRQTCQLYYRAKNDKESLESSISGLQFLMGFLIVLSVVGIILVFVKIDYWLPELTIGVGAASIVSLLIALTVVLPNIQKKKKELENLTKLNYSMLIL